MIMEYNPFGKSELEIQEKNHAKRIGNRIKTIRTEKGFSQQELGNKVGLSADRIQKYENGARKPKLELLKKIADALEVDALALADPTTQDEISTMFFLFNLENQYNMQINEIEDRICMTFDKSKGLYKYIEEWKKEFDRVRINVNLAESVEEKQKIISAYNDWKWNFPQGLVDKTTKQLQKIKIKEQMLRMEEQMSRLEEEYKKLDEE